MGSTGQTFFAFMCLISAARADTEVFFPIGSCILSLLIIAGFIWCCCRYCQPHETNVTVISAGGGGGGSNQNNFVVNMPTQPAMPQPYAPMPQQYAPMPHKYTPMPYPPRYTR